MPDSQSKEFSLRLPKAAQTQGIKAIVADDDEVVREIVAAPLRKWGLETARDGNEALQAFRRETSPVLAIFDWVMPGLDGLELCCRLRAEEKLTYILLFTARGGKQNVRHGLQAGPMITWSNRSIRRNSLCASVSGFAF